MSAPQIIPPVSQASVTLLTGTVASFFVTSAQLGPNPALISKNGAPVQPPFYSPPINFQQVPNV